MNLVAGLGIDVNTGKSIDCKCGFWYTSPAIMFWLHWLNNSNASGRIISLIFESIIGLRSETTLIGFCFCRYTLYISYYFYVYNWPCSEVYHRTHQFCNVSKLFCMAYLHDSYWSIVSVWFFHSLELRNGMDCEQTFDFRSAPHRA